MTTEIFATIGTAIGGPIGGFVGSLIGAYVDASIIQAIQGGETIEGPRTDEFRVTRSEYGIPIPLCYGPKNRVPGNIIWSAGVTEARQTEKVGGGLFGGDSKVISYSYTDSYAVAVCAREISRVTKIWANNKVIFQSEDDDGSVPNAVVPVGYSAVVAELDQMFSIFASDAARSAFLADIGANPPPSYAVTAYGGTSYVKKWTPQEIIDGIKATSPLWDFIISEWDAGRKVAVNLFPTDSYLYNDDFTVDDFDDPIFSTNLQVQMWIRGFFYSYYPRAELTAPHIAVAQNAVIYPGTLSQLPDPLMESIEGVGNVPAYAGVAYVVFQDFDLTTEFGNNVPNFEFQVQAEESTDVATVLSDLCDRAGITDRSTIGLTDSVKGISIIKNSPLSTYLPTLETAYRFRSVQQNGFVRFVKRLRGMVGSIDLNELGGRDVSESKPDNGPITYSIVPNFESPKEIVVNYFDEDRDVTVGSQIVSRSTNEGSNNFRVELPFTFSSDEARIIAGKIGKDMWSRKWSVTFRTSAKYDILQAGQSVGIPFNDEVKTILITNLSRGRNGVLEISGIYEDFNVGTVVYAGEQVVTTPVDLTGSAKSLLFMLDAPLIDNEDDDGGLYWAVGSNEAGWLGADLRYSSDQTSDTFYEFAESNSLASTGVVATALGAGPTVTWDRSNTITVELYSPDDSLSSATEAEVLGGANLIWLGAADGSRGELIQFVDATFVSGTTYTLSTLLRGRYGTDHEVDAHVVNEVMVLMDPVSVGSVTFSTVDWGQTYLYSAPSTTELVEQASVVEMINTGIRSKPLSPTHVRGSRDASNNLTITWTRRARGTRVYMGYGEVPVNEVNELYEVDISVAGGAIVRTISATSESITYSGTDQFSDGITPGNLVDIAIYQISDTKGRGYPARATV